MDIKSILKNKNTRYIIVIFLLFIFLLLSFCNSEERLPESKAPNTEIEDLEQQKSTNSILMASLTKEISEINDVLDKADSLNNNYSGIGNVSGKGALEKVKSIKIALEESNEKLEESTAKIESLKKRIAQNPSNNAPLILGNLTDMENKLKSLKTENTEIKELLDKKDKEIARQGGIITDLNEDLVKQREELKRIKGDINTAYRELSDAKAKVKKQKGDMYYDAGMEYLSEFEKVTKVGSVFGGKKMKKSFIKKAYNCFVNSRNAGNEFAFNKLRMIQNDEKYSKFLTN